MPGPERMLPSVAIFRVIAASHVAACSAEAQMHPRIAARQAFHAAVAGWRDLSDTV
jgi:hypothetical protein